MSWKSYNNEDMRWTVGYSQLFIDTWKVSLAAGGLQFYLLHETFEPFPNDLCRALILNGDAVVAYFSVHYKIRNSEWSSHAVSDFWNASCTNSCTPNGSHDSIKPCLEPQSEVGVSGLPVSTANGYKMHLHRLLSSDVGDMPETKNCFKFEACFINCSDLSYLFCN